LEVSTERWPASRRAAALALVPILFYHALMSRDGAMTLLDVRRPSLSIVCAPCGRWGRYDVAKLIGRYGDAKLTDLLQTLADCQKAHPANVHDRCKAVYEGLWFVDAAPRA
jgi:hypothetical protein